MKRNKWRKGRSILKWGLAALIIAFGCVIFAPYLLIEIEGKLNNTSVIQDEAFELSKGTMFDDYFVVEDLGMNTFAIGEPRYYQGNYSYLIVGSERALMFDAGSGTRDISPVILSITQLPITVIPSHLHYDHLAGISVFDRVAIVDLPQTRANANGGNVYPGRYEFLGMIDDLPTPSIKITEWIKPNTQIELGGRTVELLSTPGHTAESVAIFDHTAGRLFTGDFIYPTSLYAFLPGASRKSYRETTTRLLATLPATTTLFTAHCCRKGEGYSAPWLTIKDLEALDSALSKLDASQLDGIGFSPRRYKVNGQMDFLMGFPWHNL